MIASSMTATGDRPAAAWWRRAVISHVDRRSVADSDGDGVGDLAASRSRLSYLRDLGVDPRFGTLEDVRRRLDDVRGPAEPCPLPDGPVVLLGSDDAAGPLACDLAAWYVAG